MRLEYIGLSELSGSLIALEGVKDVAYDEMAEVTLETVSYTHLHSLW